MKFNLASRRLAIVLISALLVELILSAVIPQQDISNRGLIDLRNALGDGYQIIEFLGLDRIYYTPLFFLILGALAINLTWANVKRFRLIYATGQPMIRARHLGSIVFHLSLLLIMCTVIANYLFKSDRILALTEGQQVADTRQAYFREFLGPLADPGYGQFAIKLLHVTFGGEEDPYGGTRASVELTPTNGTPLQSDIKANFPLAIGDLEMHYAQRAGYSPEIQVLDSAGNQLYRSFVRLAHTEADGESIHRDFVQVPNTPLRVEAEIVNPLSADSLTRLNIKVYQEDHEIGARIISVGDTIATSPWQIIVPRLRRWCYLSVVDSPYQNLIFLGFWLGLAGMTINLVGRTNFGGSAG